MNEIKLTVDLDDTLLPTQEDYTKAREEFAEWIKSEYDVSLTLDEVKENQKSWSRKLLDDYGLSRKRFPQACVESYKEITENNNESEKAREIGQKAIGSVDFYRNKSLMSGSRKFLERISDCENVETILLTEGDEVLQERKIKAKNLTDYFDRFIITKSKKEEIQNMDYEKIYHIGNSLRSDVKPLLDVPKIQIYYIPNGEWLPKDKKIDDEENVKVLKSLKEVDFDKFY